MKIAYIMRGVPGSGKSTLAKHLAGDVGVIHSTDNYFMINGVYCFNPEKLRENHAKNHSAFCKSLSAGVEIVICDNTNTQPWHFEAYVKSSMDAGYIVAFVMMPHPDPKIAAERNTHNVSEDVIKRMITTWKN